MPDAERDAEATHAHGWDHPIRRADGGVTYLPPFGACDERCPRPEKENE